MTDHGPYLLQASSSGASHLNDQAERIAALQVRCPSLRILHGAEIDIAEDGTLDFPERALEQLDVGIASVHCAYDLSAEAQTARIVRALRHPHVHSLGHPLGQYGDAREPMTVDFKRIVQVAVDNDVALEINGKPMRRDLPAPFVRRAARLGARFVLSPDAHAVGDLDQISNALEIAQAGGLASDVVMNAQPIGRLTAWLHRRMVASL